MIEIFCSKCKEELTEPGGLLFSEPGYDDGRCEKYHLCCSCLVEVLKSFCSCEETHRTNCQRDKFLIEENESLKAEISGLISCWKRWNVLTWKIEIRRCRDGQEK